MQHDRIPAASLHKIDWELVGPAMKRIPFARRKWLTKHASANCRVGETLVKWGIQIDSDCPRCGEPESTTHVLTCQAASAKEQWNKSIGILRKWMKKQTTLPQLQDKIIENLSQWRNGEPLSYPDEGHIWPHIHQATYDQTEIGWGIMLEGCISRHWKEVQEEYYIWLDRRNTGRRWAELLIVKLVDVAWDMWEHRNHVRHAFDNPRLRKAVNALDHVLLEELRHGRGNLPESLWPNLDTTEEQLLGRTNNYKQAWLRAIEAGRKYALANREGIDPGDIGYAPEREALRRWMLTGRY